MQAMFVMMHSFHLKIPPECSCAQPQSILHPLHTFTSITDSQTSVMWLKMYYTYRQRTVEMKCSSHLRCSHSQPQSILHPLLNHCVWSPVLKLTADQNIVSLLWVQSQLVHLPQHQLVAVWWCMKLLGRDRPVEAEASVQIQRQYIQNENLDYLLILI